ncbi:NAD-P-binding protein [Amylostereum chailletii]|nr:NAD-P-binding protein [Amylostereum chailletii]
MSGYKTFALVGAGNLGPFIVEALLDSKTAGDISEVILLTRPESATKDAVTQLAAKGAKVVPVDYASEDALKAVLAGVDVVISTLSHIAPDVQDTLARAAKAAGVQLFAPSEFGNPTVGITEGILAGKAAFHARLQELGLPYALFFTGPFSDFIWAPFIGLDVAGGKVWVGADGNAPVSFTSRKDIGRYVAYVLTKLPAAELKNAIFRIEGDRKSFNEVFKAYEAKTGKKVEVTYKPVDELKAAIAVNPYDAPAALHLIWAVGGGQVGTPTSNDKFPGWNPAPVLGFIEN